MASNTIMQWFGVYDADGELIFEGSVHQLAREFNTHTSTIYACSSKNRKLNRKYSIKVIRMYEKPKMDMDKRHMTKEEIREDYYHRHLKIYGNTIIRLCDDPWEIIQWLEETGYRCEVKAYKRLTGEEIILDPKKRTGKAKTKTDYIVRWLDYDKQRFQSKVH